MQSALFLSDFNLNWNKSTKFGKNPSNEIYQKLKWYWTMWNVLIIWVAC